MANTWASVLNSHWLYAVTGVAAAVGLVLLWIGLFAGRARGRKRCPKCWYDLSGAGTSLPVTCPECGRVVQAEGEMGRTRRRWRLAGLGVLLVGLILAQAGYLHGRDAYYAVMPKWKAVERLRFGETTATRSVIRDPRERGERAVITSRGAKVLEVQDPAISLGQVNWRLGAAAPSEKHKLGAGEDCDGDGTPELVVFDYSGGAHCCYTVYVLELSDPPRVVATIDAGNGMGLEWRGPDAGGPPKGEMLFNIPDQSFDYWNAPHVSSPQPDVYYRLKNHRLEIALDQMLADRGAPPRPADLAARLSKELADPKAGLNSELWREMLRYLYSGREAQAWALFDESWPASRPGKEKFLTDFKGVLGKSLHYKNFRAAVEAQQSGKPIPPAEVPAPMRPDTPAGKG